MKRRHDDNTKVIEAFLAINLKINMLHSIYTGQSQYKTLKILFWLDQNKRTGQLEKSKLIEEIHTEKDLQRHFMKEAQDMRQKYFYSNREIIAFAYIYSTLQIITMEKLIELGKAELNCFYTFAFSDIAGEINHCLIKRQMVPEFNQHENVGASTLGGGSGSQNLKIDKMNIDFFLDYESKIWLISIDKCLVSEQVIKDTTYYSQFIFENKFIDKSNELVNFLKNLNKQEKQKRNMKALEAKQQAIKQNLHGNISRQLSIVQKNKMSLGGSPFILKTRSGSLIKIQQEQIDEPMLIANNFPKDVQQTNNSFGTDTPRSAQSYRQNLKLDKLNSHKHKLSLENPSSLQLQLKTYSQLNLGIGSDKKRPTTSKLRTANQSPVFIKQTQDLPLTNFKQSCMKQNELLNINKLIQQQNQQNTFKKQLDYKTLVQQIKKDQTVVQLNNEKNFNRIFSPSSIKQQQQYNFEDQGFYTDRYSQQTLKISDSTLLQPVSFTQRLGITSIKQIKKRKVFRKPVQIDQNQMLLARINMNYKSQLKENQEATQSMMNKSKSHNQLFKIDSAQRMIRINHNIEKVQLSSRRSSVTEEDHQIVQNNDYKKKQQQNEKQYMNTFGDQEYNENLQTFDPRISNKHHQNNNQISLIREETLEQSEQNYNLFDIAQSSTDQLTESKRVTSIINEDTRINVILDSQGSQINQTLNNQSNSQIISSQVKIVKDKGNVDLLGKPEQSHRNINMSRSRLNGDNESMNITNLSEPQELESMIKSKIEDQKVKTQIATNQIHQEI
eukprot:403343585